MNTVLSSFFEWLLRASWQGAVLALLVLAAQFCLRKRLDGRWRYLLWTLVLVRLALPISPPSSASVFNYLRLDSLAQRTPAAPPLAPPPPARFEPMPTAAATSPAEMAVQSPREVSSAAQHQTEPQNSGTVRSHFAMPNWRVVCALVWAAGVGVLMMRVALQNLLFCRRLGRARALSDPQLLELFQSCKSRMGVRRDVRLMETNAVRSPALYGLFRPRLLLPDGLIARFGASELKHIFMHELAHVRRRDMLTQRLVMCFQIAHWFNPILWIAFRRMAADREVACDELALAVAGEGDGVSYGKTIVKLLEGCSRTPALPGLVGILEDKNQMFQRISMIARFKPHSRWSIIGVALAVVLAIATLTGAQTGKTVQNAHPDLTGQVTRSDGKPAKAIVFIYTAAPKVGTSPLCPSCYADCRKSAKTDSHGHFKIESLDPQLLFRVLVVGEGCKPQIVAKIDPAAEPINISLEPQDLAGVPPGQIVHGRVVDAKGAPIEGATVEAFGIHTKDGGGGWGNIEGVDRLAVSDARGDFQIIARRAFASLDMRIEARGFAKRTFAEVRGGEPAHDLQLTEGTTIKGRVMQDGKPLTNVLVGAISEDRDPVHFAGRFDVGTDAEGRFALVNMPPNTRFMVSGLMDTPPSYGATRIAAVDTGGDGAITDAGDLEIGPASRLSGRVVLEDGKEIPPETRLLITRQGVTGPMLVELARDGSFEAGVPRGVVRLHVEVAGYHPSVKNVSLDELNPFGLIGRFEHDITNLVILMDKGKRFESHFDGFANGMDLPENRSLEGAEHANDHTRQRMASGRVIDKETGNPIATFRLTPGRSGGFARVNWNPQRSVDGTNGSYVMYFDRKGGEPVLKIEAPGYIPMASPEFSPGRTNYDFVMAKGSGPSGVVLLPNGMPCGDASILMTCPLNSGEALLELAGGGKFRAYHRPELLADTDASGHFSLTPQLGMNCVAAAAPEGFKMVSVDSLKTNAQITLEPWGSIKGILRRGGKLATNEQLSLQFAKSSQGKDLFLGIGATTDEKGAFEFDQVPPGECEVNELVQTAEGFSRYDPLQEVRVAAGQVARVTIDAAQKPPGQTGIAGGARRRRLGGPLDANGQPSQTLNGVVLSLNGKPAADAQVGLKLAQQMLHFGDGELVAGMMAESIGRTDGNGVFTVEMRPSAEALYVAHESGFAKVGPGDLTNGVKVVLQPWAKVEGTLRINNRPGANQRIGLRSIDPGEFAFPAMCRVEMTTDENGRFEFARVPAGEFEVSRWIDMGNGAQQTGYSLHFELAPGGSTNLVWGGNGRPVTGRLDMTNLKDAPGSPEFMVQIHTPYPFPTNTDLAKRGMIGARELRQWRQSTAGKEALRAFRDYSARVDRDGAFHVDDVPNGNYELSFSSQTTKTRQNLHDTTTVIVSSKPEEIVVPPPSDPAKPEPYNLGVVKADMADAAQPRRSADSQQLKTGDAAPDFETKTLEQKPLRLADYRGKYVLLDLRYMLPGAEMEGLESVNNSFGKDDRFVTISLCQDADDGYVKQSGSKGDGHWIMGDLDFSKMAEPYGLDGAPFPMIFLIGPDGKIVASQLRGEQIYASVAHALGRN